MVLALNEELCSFPTNGGKPIQVFDPRCQTSFRKLNWSNVPCFGPTSGSGTVNSSFFGRYRSTGREVGGVMQQGRRPVVEASKPAVLDG